MVIRASALVAFIAAATPVSAGDGISIRAILCDSPKHAVAYADEMAKGVLADIAMDRIGKAAGAGVCKLHRGVASIEVEPHTELVGGLAYEVTSFRFKRDGHVAWLAVRSFAPPAPRKEVAL